MKTRIAIFLFSVLIPTLSLAYLDGDLIFHESRSLQSKAIQEATGSRWSHVGILTFQQGTWFVAEAVQPVKLTPLSDFITRGKNHEFKVLRLKSLTDGQRQKLRAEVANQLGKNYDFFFEWTDEKIYCSELVYKAFLAATGIEIGKLQKFKDLNLEGPYVKELIRRRQAESGHELNEEEPIVTPASQIEDEDLTEVPN